MKLTSCEMGLKLRWPRISSVRGFCVPALSRLPKVPTVGIGLEVVEAPAEPETPPQIVVEAPWSQPPVEKPLEVPVRVIPPRQKRQRRAPKVEEAVAPSPAPKPLKVIRRRKEEAPKVFETPPREFPDAIFSGFRLRPDGDTAK